MTAYDGSFHPGLSTPAGRLSVAAVEAMIEAGILTTEDRVELLDGWLVPKMPQGDAHGTAVELLTGFFVAIAAAAGASVRCRSTLKLANGLPEPDFVVCTPPAARGGKHPTAADSFLVVEASDSSLALDKGLKLEDYAAAGIPVYWVVNLIDRRVEVYADPDGRLYRTRHDYAAGDRVPVVIRGTTAGELAVSSILS